MADMTVSEAISKRLTLERDILNLVRDFEEETGLSVDEIATFGEDDDSDRTTKVEVFVLL